jgi:glycosyltransferase involved in cell wall biosynthesis
MKLTYDIVYITNLPAFYKINLFNEISKQKKLLVIFLEDQDKQRNEDFYAGNKDFDYFSLGSYSTFRKQLFLLKFLLCNKYKELIVGGWDYLEYWIALLISSKVKNSLVIESSILESSVTGLKGIIKIRFLNCVSKVYASGEAQSSLVKRLHFKGNIIKTKGVGLFNLGKQPKFSAINKVHKFLYVGRLSPEKNLEQLIKCFNKYPRLELTIIGFGPLEIHLKAMANRNIKFLGEIKNENLSEYYQRNHVFILPSTSEAWGLVVEEALSNGLPVILSDKIGCASEVLNEGLNGIIFSLNDPNSLENAVLKMCDLELYNSLRLNVSKIDFDKIKTNQISCYC